MEKFLLIYRTHTHTHTNSPERIRFRFHIPKIDRSIVAKIVITNYLIFFICLLFTSDFVIP